MAAAIVDRLIGNASVLNIRGRSYRMRGYQDNGPPAHHGPEPTAPNRRPS